MPEMRAVDSSWVAAIGYDADDREVYVELLEGGRYAYLDVGPEVWREFVAAESKGTFVNQVLKPTYRFRHA